jgi:hypothetical protein
VDTAIGLLVAPDAIGKFTHFTSCSVRRRLYISAHREEVIDMANAVRIGKAVVMLMIAAFIIMVIVGVYTALDSAPAYTLATSASGSELESEDLPAFDDEVVGDAGDGAARIAAPSSLSASGGGVSAASLEPPVVAPTNMASGSTGSPTSGSDNNSGGTSGGWSGNSGGSSSGGSASGGSAPVPSTPAKTHHPAWDEWVEEGHYETKSIPATYGERDVFGSVCNECAANISGKAAQHLRDTRHSGYHEGVVGSESYEITPARTEQVWVDTSHWIHHNEYWD